MAGTRELSEDGPSVKPFTSFLTNTFIVVLSINHKTTQVNKTGGYLVVGAGLAGLSFVLRVSEKNKVTVLSKSELMDSNSSMAQGGIAAVQRLPDNFEKHIIPGINKECLELGFRMEADLIPVSPTAHYMCGGIKVNEYGETSIKGLLAFGETACSGVHGANRLASNSTLECMTFPHIAAERIVDSSEVFPSEKVIKQLTLESNAVSLRTQLQEIMWDNYGIIRKQGSMREAELLLNGINERTEYNFNQSKPARPLMTATFQRSH